jgi:hypothetical protein
MAAASVIADFELPADLEAREPPEARGLRRDGVRLLVSDLERDSIEHARFSDLPRWLSPGDLLIVNTSATLNAALSSTTADGRRLDLHLSTRLPEDSGLSKCGSAVARMEARCRTRQLSRAPYSSCRQAERRRCWRHIHSAIRWNRARVSGWRRWNFRKASTTISLSTAGRFGIGTSRECRPMGVNVPDYVAANPRFTLDCREPYGTGLSTIYALDGNRYVPGHDSAHLGGDVWTTDVAMEVMNREPWSALFLTFGGIDRVAHMLGERDGRGLGNVASGYRLADVARIADQQLGRLMDELKRGNLFERTLIVVTADHGGQENRSYLGNNKYQSCCPLENSEARVQPPYWIEHLLQIGKLQTRYQDTSIKIWLPDRSTANEKAIIVGMADISGMTEIYAVRSSSGRWHYERVFSRLDEQTPAFRAWAASHSAHLMDTMATEDAPDLVGLLADGFGFGRIGDHGGAQELVQRIPLLIRVPGEPGTTRQEALRLADIEAQITRIMQLDPASDTP